MSNTIRVLFWLFKARTNKQNEALLMLRVTYISQSYTVFVMTFSWLRVPEPHYQSVFFKSTVAPCILQPPAGSVLRLFLLSHSYPYAFGILNSSLALCEYHSKAVFLFTPEHPMTVLVAVIYSKSKNKTLWNN